MRRFDFRSGSVRAINDWASHGVSATGLLKLEATTDISLLNYDPGAMLGRHPTGRPQVFAVLDGEGWVSGSDGVRHPISAGEAVFWERGESHESGSGSGMRVIVIQADRLDPDARPS